MTDFKEVLPHEVKNSPTDPIERIKMILSEHRHVLFMKGNAQMPRCGFSANALRILGKYQQPTFTYDILKDPEVRHAIKSYSNWPTFPQFYVNQTLIGGNDILMELDENDQLSKVFH